MENCNEIAILALNFPPEPTGIAPYTGSLARGLTNAGHVVAAHVAHPHYPDWKIEKGYGQWISHEHTDGVEITRRLHYVPQSPRGFRRLLSELTFGLRLVLSRWASTDAVIAVSPSLFATFLVALRLSATPRRPPLIVWVQDLYTLGLEETGEGGALVQRLTRWVESRTLRSADCVVAIHPRFERSIVSSLGVEPSRVVVVRNWTHLVRSDPIDPEAARGTLDWPRYGVLAVHTGNMGAKQGLENVVEAARLADSRNFPVHFVLVGDGSARGELEKLGHGISRLSFVDPLADEQYLLALAAADVLIVNERPGVSAMAVPSKLTSYFYAGRPVVAATDPEGITASEIAAAEAGVVVPAGDPLALLQAILSMGNDRRAAAQYGSNGRRYRESVLDETCAISHWNQVIYSTISNHRKQKR